MKKQIRIAAILMFAVGAVSPTVTQAQQQSHNPAGKPPPTRPLPPIKLPSKPSRIDLQRVAERINSSPAARARVAAALASHDDRAIAAIFKSVDVDVPGGSRFVPGVVAKPGGGKGGTNGGKGGGKATKATCYEVEYLASKDGLHTILKLTPVACPA